MEINLFDLPMTSKERAAWNGLIGQVVCVLSSMSQKVGNTANGNTPDRGTVSQA